MDEFQWGQLLNPEFYIKLGGFWLVLFIIFAETGLFIGFFLPGDSLLFVSGIFAVEIMKETFGLDLGDFVDTAILASAVALAAILGNMVGYWFGRKTGPSLYQKQDNFLFKKKYLFKAHDFFEDHGAFAVIGARFLPIVRTFVPIVAGIVEMDKKKFMFDNVVGAFAWSFSLIFAGHYLDSLFANQFGIDLKKHLEMIIFVIVLITTLPIVIKLFFGKTKVREEQ
jgi:membrane-associated protein